jgi:hypothetical protein
MSRKLNSILAILAFAFFFSNATSAVAQRDRAQLAPDRGEIRTPAATVATLSCCKCLGGSNALDLSTITTNNWTINGNPVAFLTTLHPAWNLNTNGAKWVSIVAAGATNVPAGAYEYKLNFAVPACTIEQRVTLAGNYGGDDDVLGVFLDNLTTSTSASLAACSGGWCFNSTLNTNPRTFSVNVAPGNYVLRVKLQNNGGPSGMFVSAKLNSTCRN